jgi:hypothetical protein
MKFLLEEGDECGTKPLRDFQFLTHLLRDTSPWPRTLLSIIEDFVASDFCSFAHSDLAFMNLTDANLSELDFTGSNLNHCILGKTKLRATKFAGASLQGACLCGVYMRNVEWSRANLKGACLHHALIKQCCFVGSDCRSTRWRHTSVEDCNFEHCDFCEAQLAKSSWWHCNLGGSKMCRADLRARGLQTCVLRGCALTDVNLEDTRFWSAGTYALTAALLCLNMALLGSVIQFGLVSFAVTVGFTVLGWAMMPVWIEAATFIVVRTCIVPWVTREP